MSMLKSLTDWTENIYVVFGKYFFPPPFSFIYDIIINATYIESEQNIYMLKTISHNWIDKTFRFHLFFFVYTLHCTSSSQSHCDGALNVCTMHILHTYSVISFFLSFFHSFYSISRYMHLVVARHYQSGLVFSSSKYIRNAHIHIRFALHATNNIKLLLMCFVWLMGKHVTDRKIWVMKDMENIANSIWCVCTSFRTQDTKILCTRTKTMLKAFALLWLAYFGFALLCFLISLNKWYEISLAVQTRSYCYFFCFFLLLLAHHSLFGCFDSVFFSILLIFEIYYYLFMYQAISWPMHCSSFIEMFTFAMSLPLPPPPPPPSLLSSSSFSLTSTFQCAFACFQFITWNKW